MASYGFCIYGIYDRFEDYLKNAVKGTAIQNMPRIRWTNDEKRITIPTDEFLFLKEMFMRYINKELNRHWNSTKSIFDFFNLDILSIYLRGKQILSELEPEFFIDIVFSGCAGMADVSGMLGAHWAGIWYNRNKKEIDTALNLKGFLSNGKSKVGNDYGRFIPIGDYGYAIFNEMHNHIELETYSKCKYFELDQSAIIELEKENIKNRVTEKLDKYYGEIMKNGGCMCQLCNPNIGVKAINDKLGL